MIVQANPFQLRYTAQHFSMGAAELRDKANRLKASKANLLEGRDAWIGEGAESFSSRSQQYEEKIRRAAASLESAANTLSVFANQMERVIELRNRAQQLEMESYEVVGDSMDDLHRRQSLLHQAHQLRQEADWEANTADAQAANVFRSIMAEIQAIDVWDHHPRLGTNRDKFSDLPEPWKSYYARHPDLLDELEQADVVSDDADLNLTPAQLRAMKKEEALIKEMDEEQKSVPVEDLLMLYYITKYDTLSNAEPQDIIEQWLQLDDIHTVEDLKKHLNTQISVLHNNDEVAQFCSLPENKEQPQCILFNANHAGGIDPAAITGASMAFARVVTPAVLSGLKAIANKMSKVNPSKLSLAGANGEGISSDVLFAEGDHVDSVGEGMGNGEIVGTSNTSTRLKATKLSSEKIDLDWLPDEYTAVEVKGTVKVAGKEVDVSRRVYQIEIDKNYYPKDPSAAGMSNKELMEKGRAPYVTEDGEESRVELHHLIQKEPGGMVEIAETTHDKYSSALHGLVEDGNSFRNNPDLEKQYNNFRSNYWKMRANE